MPQVKIRTQADGFAADARQPEQELHRLLAGRGLGPVEVGRLAEALEDLLDAGRLLLAEPAGADRLLDLPDRRVADLLPGREALAQRGEGAVAVAVVGVLGEDGLDQLGDRVAVGMVDRPPVELAQAVADRPHPPLVGSLPAHAPATAADGADPMLARHMLPGWRRSRRRSFVVDGVRVFYRRVPGEGTPTVYCHGNPSHGEDWMPVHGARRAVDRDRHAGLGPLGPPRPRALRLLDARALGVPRTLPRRARRRQAKARRPRLGLPGPDRRPAAPGAGRAARGDQRRPPHSPATAGTGSPRSGAAARSARSSTRRRRALDWRCAAPGQRRPQRDAARVRRPDLGPLGPGHAAAPSSRLYRHADPDRLVAAGRDLGQISCPALVLWGDRGPLSADPVRRGLRRRPRQRASSRLGPAPGHWPWIDDPTIIDRVLEFLAE